MDFPAFQPFYHPEQVQRGERTAANRLGIELYELMCRAGKSVAQRVLSHYSEHQSILVLCGGGNNGGDGYIAAAELLRSGRSVTVISLVAASQLKGDAHRAHLAWRQLGGTIVGIETLTSALQRHTLVIDAMLGIGTKGQVRPNIAAIIEQVNLSKQPVISVDLPSGLDAITGNSLGATVIATETITFIAIKQGSVTGMARNYVGLLRCESLGVGQEFTEYETATVHGVDLHTAHSLLRTRMASMHKGQNGRVLLVGGNLGMSGAIRLATQAALRTGAGLTKVVTHPDSVLVTQLSAPEAMVDGVSEQDMVLHPQKLRSQQLQPVVMWADALVIGPGLGQDCWAQQVDALVGGLIGQVHQGQPLVVDADGLNWLAQQPNVNSLRIITPHPGEAARLLGTTVAEIESDRYSAARALQQKYGGIVVLKGAGTLIDDGQNTYVCLLGNPGMATGGMGDVLAGVIGALLAQGYSLLEACIIGVVVHSGAADRNAEQCGEIGLLASDVINALRTCLNPRLAFRSKDQISESTQ